MTRQIEQPGTAVEAAARLLFATRGFAGTSMRDIAKAAGVSAPNIYNYASSKEELLWRINVRTLGELVTDATAALDRSPCPVAQIGDAVARHVQFHAAGPRLTRLTKVELEHLIPQHRREVQALRARYEQVFRGIVRRGAELRMFDRTLERYAVFSILEMGYGVGVWYRETGQLSASAIGKVYSVMALRMLACDWTMHAEACPDPSSEHLVASAEETRSTGAQPSLQP